MMIRPYKPRDSVISIYLSIYLLLSILSYLILSSIQYLWCVIFRENFFTCHSWVVLSLWTADAGECDQACRSPWCGHSQAARPTLRSPRSRRLRYLQRSSPLCLMEGLSGRGLLLRQALCGRRKLEKQLKNHLLPGVTLDPGPDGTANGDSTPPRTREMTHQQRVKGCSKRRCRTAVPTWSLIAKGQTRSRRRCNR
jgi:hypothetical protein